MLPVGVNLPVAGSYSSALSRKSKKGVVGVGGVEYRPPAINTFPSGSSVAVWWKRPVLRLPVAVNVPGVCAIATIDQSQGRTKSVFISAFPKSLHTNRDGIAWPAQVRQADGDRASRRYTARN